MLATPPSPSRRPLAAAAALPLLLLLLVASAPQPTAAVKFEPAVWNAHYNVSTRNVPNALFMRTSELSEDGKMTPAPIFPLGGFNVQFTCNSVKTNGWLTGDAREKPGACEYNEEKDGTIGIYWQKVPGEALVRTNCYAYALNKPDAASWGMPGASAPNAPPLDPSKFDCKVIGAGVETDGGRKAPRDEVFRSDDATPKEGGYYIALFVRPRSGCFFSSCTGDFHFLRRDDNGLWSEKMGATPVVNKDTQGKEITDPEKAELGGGYTDFCGYYAVNPAKMKMGTMAVPDSIQNGIKAWKDAGLQVSEVPLPYLPGVDDVDPVAQQQERLRAQRGRRLMMEATAMGRRAGRWRHM
jgi:hypothetical protein